MVCEGYYSFNFGQPVCSTCHLFLFSSDIDIEDGQQEVYAEVVSHQTNFINKFSQIEFFFYILRKGYDF